MRAALRVASHCDCDEYEFQDVALEYVTLAQLREAIARISTSRGCLHQHMSTTTKGGAAGGGVKRTHRQLVVSTTAFSDLLSEQLSIAPESGWMSPPTHSNEKSLSKTQQQQPVTFPSASWVLLRKDGVVVSEPYPHARLADCLALGSHAAAATAPLMVITLHAYRQDPASAGTNRTDEHNAAAYRLLRQSPSSPSPRSRITIVTDPPALPQRQQEEHNLISFHRPSDVRNDRRLPHSAAAAAATTTELLRQSFTAAPAVSPPRLESSSSVFRNNPSAAINSSAYSTYSQSSSMKPSAAAGVLPSSPERLDYREYSSQRAYHDTVVATPLHGTHSKSSRVVTGPLQMRHPLPSSSAVSVVLDDDVVASPPRQHTLGAGNEWWSRFSSPNSPSAPLRWTSQQAPSGVSTTTAGGGGGGSHTVSVRLD